MVTVYNGKNYLTKIHLAHTLIIGHVLYCAHSYRTAQSLTNSSDEHNQNVSRYLSRYRGIPNDDGYKYRLLHVREPDIVFIHEF